MLTHEEEVMKKRKWIPTLAIVIATAAAGACTRTANEETATVEQPRYSDADITSAVQGRLYADHDIRGGRVDVSAENGVVTMRGMVSSEESKRQALQIAKGVEGVTDVRDELKIRPPEGAGSLTTDEPAGERLAAATDAAWITTKIQAQYFINPDIKPWNIDVTTRAGGIVSLRGEVDDEAAKAEAVRIARATDGVTQVEDHLRLEGESRLGAVRTEGDVERHDTFGDTFSDAWLTAKVQSKFYLDDDIRGRDIDVSTERGVTTLTGSVGSAAERRQAVAIARNTDGVLEVQDKLEVTPPADRAGADRRVETTARSGAQAVEDGWITTKIQSQYFLDTRVKGHDIDVDTQKGVVTLTGSVSSPELKQAAEEIARDTEGTVRVINRLTVTS
jgi:osmotically-inducible protein OsmY